MTTLVFTHPTNDPDPVTNPLPGPKPAVVPYALLVAGLLFMLAAGVLGIVGHR